MVESAEDRDAMFGERMIVLKVRFFRTGLLRERDESGQGTLGQGE
jgi:hypothetical protein